MLPIASIGVAALLTALVLPSLLRPPPEQSQSSAAFSPDAPPDEETQTIIQSLRQAASRTAGATGSEDTVPATTTPTVLAPSRGQCFGDPPRQTESAYSPPCRPAWSGDNGGATYKNVTGDVVRVAYWHAFGMPSSSERGDISDVPPPGESAAHRTARVLQQYFNDRYELYGRRLQLYAIPQDPATPEEYTASAVATDEEGKAFAAIQLETPFCHEFTRRGLICFGGNGYMEKTYLGAAPRWWSYQMGTDKVDRMTAEYICKKLAGGTADFAGGNEHGKPRRIAVIAEGYYGNDFRTYDTVTGPAKEMCGFEPQWATNFDGTDSAQTAAVIAGLRSRDITTVIGSWGLVEGITLYSGADASGYSPEWVLLNSYGLDFNDAARLLPPNQLQHMFGMSGWELPRPAPDQDCYRAYKSVDPAGEPDGDFCRLLYIQIEHVVNGIQEARPNLTDETFARGMWSMPLEEPRTPWAIGGGYSPSDFSFVDDLAEIWWSPSCVDPEGGEPGCWMHTANGRRWRPGELDTEIRVFRDGVAGHTPA